MDGNHVEEGSVSIRNISLPYVSYTIIFVIELKDMIGQ